YTIQQRLKYFITKSMSWNKAREECISKGADLVIINSQEEQEYISKMVTGEAWIGLHDTVQEGKWMWVDGTEVTTKFWQKGQPNEYAGNEDCAVTHSNYAKGELTTWADYPCETDFHAICEKRANI
ncbi:hepatic lectin-like isoform X2, partial [Tachysurus ichikawai]